MMHRREFSALLLSSFWTQGLRAAGFQQAALAKITADIKRGAYPNTHALLIEQDGKMVYEQYFTGKDERLGDSLGTVAFNQDSLHDLRSCSKSVTSAILGIALGADYAKALEHPIPSFFPNLKLRPELNALKLKHVLTFTAGLEWNEMEVPYTDPKNDEIQMSMVKDPVALVLSRPLKHKPGEVWYYCGGATQVLAGVVKQITGKPLDLYGKEVLFGPLGITNYEWIPYKDAEPPVPIAAAGLRMRARDLARFGSVYLHGGKWEGKQIVPAAWVEASMQRHVQSIGAWGGPAKYGYGYQWWIGTPGGVDVAAAVGNGNQRVFVAQKERVVVTIFAGEYNRFEGYSERLFANVMAAHA
jgi:CubicO group peptidase (beta-lactamase class C family)